ncbi:MAG: pitrilysin family protein [Candidatus Dormiibacterota bacterium]
MTLASNHALHELTGGARLLTAPLPDRASASLVLMFGVGSRFEDDRIGGISHFIEHLAFKGTRRRPTSKAIAEAIEGVGGVMNASTDKEVTMYWARVPADRLELAVDVLGDIVSDSQLSAPDVERERMVILEELKMYLDQPQDYVHSLFEEVMWPDHPLGRDIIGTVESVSSTTRDDLIAYLSEHYRPRNLVAGASGGIDPDRAARLVDEHLALPGSGAASNHQTAPGPLASGNVRLLRKDTEQAHLCLGARGLSYLDDDRYVLDLVTTILGEGMSSRLFLEIREQRGLAYDVHAYTSKHRDAGYFGIYMGVDPQKAQEAVEAAVAELRRIIDEPVPVEELTKAKEFVKGRLRLGLEGTNALASWLCQQVLLTGRTQTIDEVLAKVEAVTAEDVRRVAAQFLGGPLQAAVIGPFPSDGPFRTAIGV